VETLHGYVCAVLDMQLLNERGVRWAILELHGYVCAVLDMQWCNDKV